MKCAWVQYQVKEDQRSAISLLNISKINPKFWACSWTGGDGLDWKGGRLGLSWAVLEVPFVRVLPSQVWGRCARTCGVVVVLKELVIHSLR